MKYLIPLFFSLLSLFSNAQSGINGYIKSTSNKPLAYATIYIKELKTGTISNENGYFEFRFPSGDYNLNFHYLGYKPENLKITVKNEFLSLNVKLTEQSINLTEVNIVASAEDPAYSIMRKVVVMSKYHLLKIKSYKANVYIKGFFKIDIPKLIYKAAKSEGLDTVEVNTSESFNEVEFEYPNIYKQTVISTRSNQKDTVFNEAYQYIQGSFYSSSLLSPSTFNIYRFKLEGSFEDRGHEIYKIKVIPRSMGTDTYDGYIYVIDKLWALHSLNLNISQLGFKTNIEQVYAPVANNIWLPVSHKFDIKGRFLGTKINHNYFATVSNYLIAENQELNLKNIDLIDEKIENEIAKAKLEDKKIKTDEFQSNSMEDEKNDNKFSLKEFKKKLKEVEKKNSKPNNEKPRLLSDYSMNFDSLASKRSNEFWDSIRPIPLTDIEKKPGLMVKNDSITQARKQDTSSNFAFIGKSFGKIIFGSNINITKRWNFVYPSPLIHLNFNTVEGYNLNLPLQINYKTNETDKLIISPTIRYSISKQFYHKTQIQYQYLGGLYQQKNSISLEGGRYINQFNSENPIAPILNTITSLFWIENHMKIYQKDYVALVLKQYLKSYLRMNMKFEYDVRKELFNSYDNCWVKKNGRNYKPNAPLNREKENTTFSESKAAFIDINLTYKPYIKFYSYNNKIRTTNNNSPTFNLTYSLGLKNIFGSNSDFQKIDGSISHKFNGIKRDLDVKLFGGTTFFNKSGYFIDYKHFNGNSTIIQTRPIADGFYLLDYYRYSTNGEYLGAYTYLSFRKFLLTQNLWLNLLGVKEAISFNYLKTYSSPHYIEVGYGLDNILRIFKIQAVASFENGKYLSWGLRIGLSGLIRFQD